MANNMRRILISLILMGICVSGYGCTLFNIQLGPSMAPLKEKTISGNGPEKILLIDIEGVIADRRKESPLGAAIEGGVVERVKEVLLKAEKDDDIKAILLRINSPGGTVTASDIIYHDLKVFKKNKNIKIYAVFMDTAASGGYYIAMSADRIFAHPTSVTGSIGVIAIKPNLKGLMEKIGVEMEVVKSGDKKDFLSPFRMLTDEERKLFQEAIDGYYDRFVKIIAENRPGLNLGSIKALADGRVYNADQALSLKLVDRIGYLDDTLDEIKSDLGFSKLKVVTYHRPGDYKNNIYSSLSGPPSINLLNIDLFDHLSSTATFMYLWMP